MLDSLFKALTWFFLVACFILGIWAIQKLETAGIEYAMLFILGFGGAWLFSGAFRTLPPKAMIASGVLVMVLACVALYRLGLLYVLLGIIYPIGFYQAWALLSFLIGVPFMTAIFHKFD